MTATRPAAASGLRLTFDGPRLLDGDGRLLAWLAADGYWYDEQGERCHGLTLPAATPPVPPGGKRSQQILRADDLWMQEACETIMRLAQRRRYLTADEVWVALRTPPRQSRMVGNALASAKQAGVIAATGGHQPSIRKQNHGRPILIWRSLIYGQQTHQAP